MVHGRFAILVSILGVNACGTMPVPQQPIQVLFNPGSGVQQQRIEQAIAAEEANIVLPSSAEGDTRAMSATTQKPAVSDTTTPLQQAGSIESSNEEADSAQTPIAQKQYRTARGYWKHAIDLLQRGQESEAVAALQQALKLEPQNRIATKLLKQTRDNPQQVLGEEYFELTIGPGQTLSVLAREYLNDALQFYILARYNQIENPGDVKIGSRIKIPGKRAIPQTVADTPKPTNALAFIKRANAFSRKKQYGEAAALLEDYLQAHPDEESAAELKALLVNNYIKQANYFLARGEYQQAKNVLDQAIDMESNSSAVQRALLRVETVLKVEDLYQHGLAAKQKGEIEKAYDYFNNVLAIDGGHPGANRAVRSMKQAFVPVIYRKALAAQRRQELDAAILLWDELLRLDPEHENARLYRSKAMALKTNLQKFAADN